MGLISRVSSRTYRFYNIFSKMASQSLKNEIELACEENPQMRNMREFFHAYGKASAYCFEQCITNFNRRSLSDLEHICIRSCGLKSLTGQQKNYADFSRGYAEN